MTNDYAARIARGAKLTPEQHDKFLHGLPQKLFTDEEKSEIKAALVAEGVAAIESVREIVSDKANAVFLSHMAGFDATISTRPRRETVKESETD